MTFFENLIKSIILLFSSKEVWGIAALSFLVSTSAVLISAIIGIPIGIYIGLRKGKSNVLLISLLNTGMGLPPVVVGLLVFLLIMRNGPLGEFSLLFTPIAMIMAQAILTLPIIIGITRTTIRDLPDNLPIVLKSMGANKYQIYWEIFCEARSGMLIACIVALGRAFSEVGAIIIVGGNIRFHTRVLTTAIITEISKGNQSMALALGIILLFISFLLTSVLTQNLIHSNRNEPID
ncbi:MAG: ABC transporter permease [Candidatus Heimdallarchaeota archaeon]|nr:ABC transporter permease [Candidatus Heimdallarchaeota archaeon]MDH5645136.1 ABC transporter permease [Candidatus Heimdallarchaeota archaeon]